MYLASILIAYGYLNAQNTLHYMHQDAVLAKPDGNHLRGYMVPYNNG